MNLRLRFNLLLIPTVILGFAFLNMVIIFISLNALNVASQDSVNGNSALLEKNIHSWLSFNRNVIVSLTNSPFVTDTLTDNTLDTTKLNAHLEALKEQFSFRNVAVLNQQGIALAASNSKRINHNYQ